MRKSEELSNPNSCINKSDDGEWLFVLCARDRHSPAAVRKWADEYEAGGGRPEKVAEARACADKMEAWRQQQQRGTLVVEAGSHPAELPRWKCHKEVWAARIVSTDYATDSVMLEGGIVLEPGVAWMNKHRPQAGGYFVRYADGYESYIPAAAFEEGYTRIGGTP